MDLANLPIIDREMGLKLAGNKEDLAQDLLDFFIRTLPEEFEAIQAAHNAQDSATLLKRVHKLHGAVCYCGLPRLKTLLARLETDLKNNIMINSSSHLEQLTKEIELLLEYHARPTPIGLK